MALFSKLRSLFGKKNKVESIPEINEDLFLEEEKKLSEEMKAEEAEEEAYLARLEEEDKKADIELEEALDEIEEKVEKQKDKKNKKDKKKDKNKKADESLMEENAVKSEEVQEDIEAEESQEEKIKAEEMQPVTEEPQEEKIQAEEPQPVIEEEYSEEIMEEEEEQEQPEDLETESEAQPEEAEVQIAVDADLNDEAVTEEEVDMQTNPGCYINRELSWLRFNERVLEEAEDERVPLCERLSFLSIFQTNLDEFFMVRIGGLYDQMVLDKWKRENKTYMTPKEQIVAASDVARSLCERRDRLYGELKSRISDQGITIMDFRSVYKAEEPYFKNLFKTEIRPLLSTYLIGKKQSFPFLKDREIYAIAVLSTKSDKQKIGIVHCGGNTFPRLIPVPERPGCYVLAEYLILHFLPELFEGCTLTNKALVRITRSADIDADSVYDEDLDYRDHIADVIKKRKKLAPVRIEFSRALSSNIISTICKYLKLKERMVFEYDSPLDFDFVYTIRDYLRSHSELFYAPRHPQKSPDVNMERSMIDQVMEKDIMLSYPYQSINPFIKLLSDAAKDPEVVSVKITLYRLAKNSRVVESLIEAAENGKQVKVLVELKARFDEQNNIEASRRLEQAGCHVIYGITGLKVHSKLCLITKKTAEGIKYISQVGTGNYNEKTSELYTDLCIMTADEEIGKEAAAVFHALTLDETVDHMQHLLVAPHCLQNKLLDHIDGEIKKCENGEKGLIRLKMNSLTDKVLIDKLIDASKAGVEVRMVVRGICCLCPGVKDYTENIHVISIVGRYLEHSRIYMFGEGENMKCYISSADWMTRNTLRRVEVALPVSDKDIRKEIEETFEIMWTDNVMARELGSDHKYTRRMPYGAPARASQEVLYDRAYKRAMVND